MSTTPTLVPAQPTKKKFTAPTSRHWNIFILTSVIGVLLIAFSYSYGEKTLTHHFLRDIGIAIIPIGIMSLVYEYLLRDHFLHTMEKTIYQTIEERIPQKYKNMRDSGIVDVYSSLQIDRLKNHLRDSEHSEVKILDIWVENFHHIEDLIIAAVLNKKCTVRILLWDLKQVDVLKRRAAALGKGKDEKFIIQEIYYNLVSLKYIQAQIDKAPLTPTKGSISIQLYKSFIGVSLLGFGGEFYAGLYLRNRVSSMGSQLKVVGNHHFLYQELDDHFESQWNDPSNIKCEKRMFKEYKKWVNSYKN